MAQISLVKTLVLSYMELQRQIDRHPMDAPSYLVKGWREEQEAILANLVAKEPMEAPLEDFLFYKPVDDPKRAFEQLLESQRDEFTGQEL